MIRSKGKMDIIILIITNVCKNLLCLRSVHVLNVVLYSSFNSHSLWGSTAVMDIILLWNWGKGKLSNLSEVTQLVSGGAGIWFLGLWGQSCWNALSLGWESASCWPGISVVIEPSRYCGLKTHLQTSPLVGFMVTNQCTFHTPIGFPQVPVAALAVEKVGHSSVHYRLALFPPKPAQEPPTADHRDLSDGFFFGHPKLAPFDTLACTTGSSVHVFVNPATSKPTGLPEDFRRGLLRLRRPASVWGVCA